MTIKPALTARIPSIEVFRALTMALMVYVNDLWTLAGVPHWMEHAETHEDFLGLSDIVFPAFLFIMGLSIPYAIRNRIANGYTQANILGHILLRALVLLIMGLFTLNSGSINGAATGIRPEWFEILMVTGFFLVWNVYPKAENRKKYLFLGLQGMGLLLLACLAIIYRRGGSNGTPLGWIRTGWWGILGEIGWAYLGAAIIYLLARKKTWLLVLSWLGFTFMTIASHSGLLKCIWPSGPVEWIPGNGAYHSFSLAGIIVALLIERFYRKESWKLLVVLLATSVALLLAGILSRHYFIMSKNLATPTWIFTTLAISIAFYGMIHWLVDRQGKANWFRIIAPAGIATLTCYLIPYLIYSFRDLLGALLPAAMKSGTIGLVKSFVYTLLVIGITALLGKMKIRLKI